MPTQGLGNDGKTGTGEGKAVNDAKLEAAGLDPKNQEVSTNQDPKGFSNFDFTGLDQDSIKEIVTESKAFAEKAGKDLSNLRDTIIEEAPFDELKDVAERLTPILKETAESFDIESTFEMF